MAVSRNTLEIPHPLREVLAHSSWDVNHILSNIKIVNAERQRLPCRFRSPSSETFMSSYASEPVEGTVRCR